MRVSVWVILNVLGKPFAANVHLETGRVGGEGIRRSDKPTIVVGNKIDLGESADNLDVMRDLYDGRYVIIPVSSTEGTGLDRLAAAVFDMLDLVRVFTKEPGKKEPTGPPYALRRGASILDLARTIHRDFPERLRTARSSFLGARRARGGDRYRLALMERRVHSTEADIAWLDELIAGERSSAAGS